jgi:hypothetical protein
MPLVDLPMRRERAAPTFADSEPEELEQYFTDLQALLTRHSVANVDQCKRAAVKYVTVTTARLWKSTAAWADTTQSYADFRAEVFRLYPSAASEHTYRVHDLDLAIGHSARTGIHTVADLGEYNRLFLLISRYLISKGRISAIEQPKLFLMGFQQCLEAQIRQRLQAKFINHIPDDPYALADIYNAATFILQTTAAMPATSVNPAAFTLTVATPDPTPQALSDLTVTNPVRHCLQKQIS